MLKKRTVKAKVVEATPPLEQVNVPCQVSVYGRRVTIVESREDGSFLADDGCAYKL